MPGNQKNIQDAKTGADPDLKFSYNELMEELKAEYDCSERLPGDITPREMSDVTNLTERQWYEILNKKVRKGELEKLRVKGKEERWSYYVYRKAKNIEV